MEPSQERPLCRSCGVKVVNRPRGLCWHCYYRPGNREKYPSTSKFARRGVSNCNGRDLLPAQPTQAAPGSEAKVLVMIERAARHELLFRSDDAEADPESREMRTAGCCQAPLRLRWLYGCLDANYMTEMVGGSKGEERKAGVLDFAREGG